MLVVGGTQIMTEDQLEAWEVLKRDASVMEEEGTSDPWVFHGTTEDGLVGILRDGFRQSYAISPEGGSSSGVHWGDARTAIYFAESRAGPETGLPILLRARLSDVLASGRAIPDLFMWQYATDDEHTRSGTRPRPPKGWKDCLDTYGAFVVEGGTHVRRLEEVRWLPDGHVREAEDALWRRGIANKHPEWAEGLDDQGAAHPGM